MRLIDADALIAETMKNRCADCDRRKGIKQGKITFLYDFGEAPCRACDVGDMIDILNEAQTIGGWISDNDKPPQSGERYLTVGARGVMRVAKAYVPAQVVAGWQGDADYHWWECEGKRCSVTHYMQLPVKPEGSAP